jgi:hypothetical protein
VSIFYVPRIGFILCWFADKLSDGGHVVVPHHFAERVFVVGVLVV